MQGRIIKGIAGFYYVHASVGGVYECKAKGIFRKDNKKPLPGDIVELEILDEAEKLGNITQLLPRRSELIRPAVANVDQALVILACADPAPNCNLLDRFLITIGQQRLPCVICFNKQDLVQEERKREWNDIYSGAGYRVVFTSAKTDEGLEELSGLLEGKTTTVAGPSGVGKSSLINALQSGVVMETGEISRKIGRGKHTTRHSEIICIRSGTYIVDTPGFSTLTLFDMEKEELAAFFPDFAPFEKGCRFAGCAHRKEPGCAVKQALEEGKISENRYANYCQLYDELKNKKRY